MMIYVYKGKRVVAKSYTEASKMLKITKDELKKNGKEVRYVLREEKKEEKEEFKENLGYSNKLQSMLKKVDGKDSNLHQKMAVAQLKDNVCAICGKQYIPSAMTFHHVEPTLKAWEIRVGRIRFKGLQEEIGKTVLLCLICHAYVHRAFEMPTIEEGLKAMKDYYKECDENENK